MRGDPGRRDGEAGAEHRLPEGADESNGHPTAPSCGGGERRAALRYPPAGALAVVSGAAAAAAAVERPSGVELLGPADGRWMVRAASWSSLADWLSTVERPPGRLRIEVDPPRA